MRVAAHRRSPRRRKPCGTFVADPVALPALHGRRHPLGGRLRAGRAASARATACSCGSRSAEIGGLVEVVEYDEPRDLAWTSVTGIDQRGRWRLRERAAAHRTHVELRLLRRRRLGHRRLDRRAASPRRPCAATCAARCASSSARSSTSSAPRGRGAARAARSAASSYAAGSSSRTVTTASAAAPSSRPTKPIPSPVEALTLTGARSRSSAAARLSRIAAR